LHQPQASDAAPSEVSNLWGALLLGAVSYVVAYWTMRAVVPPRPLGGSVRAEVLPVQPALTADRPPGDDHHHGDSRAGGGV